MHSRHYTSLVQAGQISNLTAAFPFQTLNAVNFTVCQLEKFLSEKTFNFSDSSLTTAASPFLQHFKSGRQWNGGESNGEALSGFLPHLFHDYRLLVHSFVNTLQELKQLWQVYFFKTL